jgi:HK97 family phage prohead protease
MKQYEIKNTDNASVKDVDTTGRRVKVAISRMGNLDLDNDVIDKGAYTKTVKERGPEGAKLIWHLTDHNATLKSAVGKFSEILVENDYLVGITDIPKTAWGNDMLEFYKTGHINQHSVGFRTVKSDTVNKGKDDEHRLIKEIMLYEGSAVLWGANPDTPTLGKSLTKEDIHKDYFETLKEVNNLAKLFKSGHLTDETFELLEVQLAQKTDKLKQLFDLNTLPAADAVEPKNGEELLDALKAFNNSLILQNGIERFAGAAG